MGARLMRIAIGARWASLPEAARIVLAHMADTALDADGQPVYWGGRDGLVIKLCGFLSEDAAQRRWQYKRLDRLVGQLKSAGAVRVLETATGQRRARYLLTLEKNRKSAPPTSAEKDPISAPPTSDIPAPSRTPNGHQVAPHPMGSGGKTEDKPKKDALPDLRGIRQKARAAERLAAANALRARNSKSAWTDELR
jgi:hypothetical protein